MRVAVVGGGVAGLAAAWTLARGGADVTVLEGADRVGGKVRSEQVGDLTIDVGAESMLARRPEALALVDELGLGQQVVHPAPGGAAVWTRGALRPLPRTVMGVPADLDALMASGIVAERPVGHAIDVPEHDESVRDFLAPRVGQEVVDRLVEPLLGGVYAGHASRLSLRSAAPQVLALGPDPLTAAAATPAVTSGGPVFAGLSGGVQGLVEGLHDGLRQHDATVRTGVTVRDVRRESGGWVVVSGPVGTLASESFDAVVVATPAAASARLLASVTPRAAFALAGVDHASLAIVTFVLASEVPVEGSGFLVPPVDGTTIKASTFSSRKWPWLADRAGGAGVLRASVGRAGETALLQRPDDQVASAALADLRSAVPDLSDVVASHVQRWGGGLPQYDVGHAGLVHEVEDDVAGVDGLEVCGAAYRGVGVPAVIGSARAAADRLLAR